jgi:hypothetical protein
MTFLSSQLAERLSIALLATQKTSNCFVMVHGALQQCFLLVRFAKNEKVIFAIHWCDLAPIKITMLHWVDMEQVPRYRSMCFDDL